MLASRVEIDQFKKRQSLKWPTFWPLSLITLLLQKKVAVKCAPQLLYLYYLTTNKKGCDMCDVRFGIGETTPSVEVCQGCRRSQQPYKDSGRNLY